MLILLVVILGVAYALPNVFPAKTMAEVPDWLPHKQVNLGLDLQGGAHLLYEIDEQQLVDDWLKTLRGETRSALRDERIGYTNLQSNPKSKSVSVRIRENSDFDKAVSALDELSVPIDTTGFGMGGEKNIDVQEGDNRTVTLAITEAGLNARINGAIESSIETIRRRIDAFGTSEPSIQRQGRDRILVQFPGIQDVQRLKGLINETGKLDFQMVDPSADPQQVEASKRPPAGSILAYSADEDPKIPYVLKDEVLVSGENLVDAQPGFDGRTGEPIVSFRFDSTGAKRFARATQENVGLPFAIVLDGKVISAPRIQEPILGGSGQISGNFTVEEANDLAILLRSGALPAKLTPIEERTVGASLGADSIASGKRAAVIAVIAVMVFMVLAYGLFGLFADLALLLNAVLIFAALSLIGATLTLPGIAGIVLVIGISVDSNVLIFERIREEVRSGKSPLAAIDAGYSRAMATIIDSNVTTLISTLVLFWLGSGPVRGFAVTLCIGIVCSMFTAVTFSRMIVSFWLRWTRPQVVPI
ncbi:protein translocase subunit SecD [Methyloligella solikamskensis]|uniref:Protein translocase subunit SecD n=1 Tax=Methyloligella solikamskensis TaxID=1177756 RepID=A0ABW3JB36_9HYPH